MNKKSQDVQLVIDTLLQTVDNAQSAYTNNMLEPNLGPHQFQAALVRLLESVFTYRIQKLDNKIAPDQSDADVHQVIQAAVTFAGYQCLFSVDNSTWSSQLNESLKELFKLNSLRRQVAA
jgi:hypothetical protein